MGLRSRIRTNVIEARCQWRFMKQVPRIMPGKPFSSAVFLDERVAETPDSLAIAYMDERYTWRQVDGKVNQYARFLQKQGVKQGDVVALFMDNRPDYLFALTALNRLRAVGALINTNITGAGLVHAINIGKPVAALFGSEHADAYMAVKGELDLADDKSWAQLEDADASAPEGVTAINELVDAESAARPDGITDPDTAELFCYIYTSGTTGLPKAAVISNKRWIAAAYLFGAGIMNASPRDIIYVPLPLYHSSAMFAGWGSSLVSGAGVALRRKFSASAFWDDVKNYDCSIFLYIGELCRYLLNTPRSDNERSHRVRLAVGNGLRPDIWQEFQSRFNVRLIREFYGATEGNAPIVNFEGRPGMIGRLRPGQVIIRCDEETGEPLRNSSGFCERVGPGEKGLLLGKINKLMSFDGYVDKKATQKKVLESVFKPGDRYFNSGDIIELHEHGWAAFADRVGDTFRWKGENVSTNEVAEILNGAKGVLETNVYGVKVPNADGRAGMSSVNADDSFSVDEFASFVREKLPAYQRPFFLRIQTDMRITGTFKHQKVDYRKEGYDPAKVSDPLYFLDGEKYVPIDAELYKKLEAGEVAPR